MLQVADTDLFNPLVPKAHKSECQNLPLVFRLQATTSQLKREFFISSPSSLNFLIHIYSEFFKKVQFII